MKNLSPEKLNLIYIIYYNIIKIYKNYNFNFICYYIYSIAFKYINL